MGESESTVKLQLRDPEKLERRGKPLATLGTKTGLILYEKGIEEIRGDWQPFDGHYVEVRYETAGDLSRRFTATRIALVGVFALAWKKTKDKRTAFVTVEVDGQPLWIHEIAPDKAGKALAFAKKVSQASQ
jgi:hypothetical protein